MLPNDWQNVRRILAIQLGGIEDVKLTDPALRKLRQLLPNSAVTLMISPDGSQIATEISWLNEILLYEGAGLSSSNSVETLHATSLHHGTSLQGLIERLSHRLFDAAVIFTNDRESPYPLAYICYLAGIPIRLGQSQEFGGSVLSHWVKPLPTNTHPINQHLLLIESAFKCTDTPLYPPTTPNSCTGGFNRSPCGPLDGLEKPAPTTRNPTLS